MYADDTYEELSRQSLAGQAVAINDTARAYFRASAMAERTATSRRTFQDTHGTVGRVTLMKVVEYATFALGLACIYVIDVLLFGASAQYIASLLGSESDLWAALAKFVVPAAFLGIEVLIALQIETSRQEARFAFGSALARRGWIALGVLVALVMPLAAKATAESASIVAESDTPVMMLAVLGIISFSAHVLVLFGGRLAQESKTYFAFAFVRGFHDVRANGSAREAASSLASLNSMFIGYVHAWRAHNARFPAQPSGPFDREVVELLRRQFPHVASGGAATVFPHSEEPA
jgi:hypothetical protein